MESLDNPMAYRVGLALLGVGSTFVLSSFFALGFTGTFLGKTPGAGGPGGSRGQVADCPAIWDIFVGSPGGAAFGPPARVAEGWGDTASAPCSPPPTAQVLLGCRPNGGLAGGPHDISNF